MTSICLEPPLRSREVDLVALRLFGETSVALAIEAIGEVERLQAMIRKHNRQQRGEYLWMEADRFQNPLRVCEVCESRGITT